MRNIIVILMIISISVLSSCSERSRSKSAVRKIVAVYIKNDSSLTAITSIYVSSNTAGVHGYSDPKTEEISRYSLSTSKINFSGFEDLLKPGVELDKYSSDDTKKKELFNANAIYIVEKEKIKKISLVYVVDYDSILRYWLSSRSEKICVEKLSFEEINLLRRMYNFNFHNIGVYVINQ